jgi:hypothetical protein
MKMKIRSFSGQCLTTVCLSLLLGFFLSTEAVAHCETLDGPVIKDAKKALKAGDVSPVLKWVKKEHEAQIREQFKKTMAVRSKGAEARELADMYFFETLVRLHRAGEGAPYTGLKSGPAEPLISMADEALRTGSVDALLRHLTTSLREGVKQRFAETLERKHRADASVEAGREYVESYVQYTHYVEGIEAAVAGGQPHKGSETAGHQHPVE